MLHYKKLRRYLDKKSYFPDKTGLKIKISIKALYLLRLIVCSSILCFDFPRKMSEKGWVLSKKR